MRTKNPQDLVLPGNSVGLYSKSGYASKNNEFRQVLGLGVGLKHWFSLPDEKPKKPKTITAEK
ncbi:hypothetical protein CFY87_02575 [Actinobacillus seminis]|uniref:Uncharacterized protein n=1 Tax=Actinobacillus seminis TaxID=722 RepID=A0ABX4FNS9_9PAST|nr:hypothetical protein CFY87_02575 [Actinobacillus seminis]